MRQKKGKKFLFLFYLTIIFLSSSLSNLNLKKMEFFKVKEILVNGLTEKQNLFIKNNFRFIYGLNIFFLDYQIFDILSSNNEIKKYSIKKVYPSRLIINLEPAKILCVVHDGNNRFILGDNGKLLNKSLDETKNYLKIFNSNDFKTIIELIDQIKKSKINYESLDQIIFYPSKRYDLRFKNNLTIRYPIETNLIFLNKSAQILKQEKFKNLKSIDLRIPGKIITNE